jgi:PAS domain S-box-containing protein
MHDGPRTQLVACGVAVLVTAVSLLVRWPLWPVLERHTPFMTFIPAVVISAYWGGLRPGLLATLLGALAGTFFLTEPGSWFEMAHVHHAVGLALFVLTGAIISGLSESLHRAQLRIKVSERKHAQEALAQERHLLHTLMDNLPDNVYFKDTAGCFLRINQALTHSFGLGEPAQAIGKTDFDFYTQEHARAACADEQQIIRTGQPVVGKEEKETWRDGRVMWVSTTRMPFRDCDGRITGTFGVARDITRLKLTEEELRASEHRFRTFVDHATDAFFLQDDRGVILDVNRQACASLGYTRDELVGMVPPDFDPDATPALLDELSPRLEAGETVAFESRHRRKDGTLFPVEVRGRAFWEGGRRFLVSLARDISQRKQDEALLDGQKRILKRIIQGEPLANVLTFLCRTIEELAQGEMLASVLLLDADGVHLRHGAAPSLPDSYNRIVDGLAIGPTVGSCGTAAYRREPVYVWDIASDPLWAPYAHIALSHGLRACWSSPILSSAAEVLGTFAMYYRQPRQPTPRDLRVVDIFTRTVAIAIERSRAEQALRESEQRWRCLTESLPQLVWSAAPDGACDYFSTQWTQHTGIPQSDLLGWRWLETLHPDDQEPTRRFWLDSVAGRRPYDVEYRVRRRDGVYRWFKTRGTPIRDEAGRIVNWFGTCTDITDLRQAEEALRQSEERFRGTFENAAVGIAHTDSAGRFLRLNEKFCTIVGYYREELLHRAFQDITHPDDLTASVEPFTVLMRGESPDFGLEKRYVRKDGSTVWAELFVSLQRDTTGKPAYAIAVIHDISQRKQLEGDLRRARDAAESANRAKDDFLANVSHEIRTPMNAILGMTDLALATPLSEDQRQCLRTVKSASDNLLGIINDLLDFAKIEAGKMELDPADFSLRAAIGDTLRALAMRAHRKGLELVCQVQPDVPDALVGDAGRLRQVLLNLIGNAIKFTEHGEVEVRVGVNSEQSSVISEQSSVISNQSVDAPSLVTDHCSLITLHFDVRDTGIGIPSEKQERIFRAFEQEDTSTTRKYGGTGLGLTIASRLLALMGGQITVDSKPGRGSTFAFTARFGRQPHPAEPVAVRAPLQLHNLRVLVVDDNATSRHILKEWLRGWQMEPRAVSDGPAALDALGQAVRLGQPYPLVLLDARMPELDGPTLAARVRERADLAATRLILLSSGDRPGDWARIAERRIDAHLLKPVQKEELLETISRVMSPTASTTAARPVPAEIQEPVPAPVPSAASLRILVAEDNEFNVQLLELLLVRRGHRVRLASNGREALALAQQGGFDLLLLDIHMPELDGFAVVAAIRERERAVGGHLPIVALTARSRPEDRERCLAAGMDDFLAKPVQVADLWSAIDRVVAAHPPGGRPESRLLDPAVLLAACGGDDAILRKISQAFRDRLPEHLTAVQDALRDSNAPRLREAAHKLCGMVAAFSTVVAAVASDLEDQAAAGRLEESRLLVGRLEVLARELLGQVDGLTLESLRHQAG